MKILLFFIGLIFVSCGNYKEKNEIPYFGENQLSFGFLKDQYNPSNTWIKEPDNILMLHETFKSIGYKEILNRLNWKEDWTLQIDNKRSLKTLIDSLEINYQNSNCPKYYKEFWQRRSKEGNDEIVYKVIKEIKLITNGESILNNLKAAYINDTLKYLVEIEIKDSLNCNEANKFLNYLIKVGMHQSAWNVRSGENYNFENISWKSEDSKIYEKLTISDKFIKPWVEDNTK